MMSDYVTQLSSQLEPTMAPCDYCHVAKAALRRPKTGDMICKECFFVRFETEIHDVIVSNSLFRRGERVCIAASGGKDSTVLAHVLTTLNKRYDYGLDLFLLSIDEGITGYRDDSLETVKQNQVDYQIPLKIVSYQDLYGWTMDRIVSQIGLKNNCAIVSISSSLSNSILTRSVCCRHVLWRVPTSGVGSRRVPDERRQDRHRSQCG
jgi:hypothetical protein